MITEDQVSSIRKIISDATVVHLYTHAFPDGDAVASLAAFNYVLTKQRKITAYKIVPGLAAMYQWLPVQAIPPITSVAAPDAIVVLDAGQLHQLGALQTEVENLLHKVPVINIDHHYLTSDHFGNVNVVESASSTTEILYELFSLWPLTIDSDLATILLYGLVSDTHFFQKSNTSEESFVVAARLSNLGAEPSLVAQRYHKSKSLQVLKFWGEVISSIEILHNGDIGIGSISSAMFMRYQVEEHTINVDGLINFLTAVESTKVTVLLKERGDFIRVSFRSDFYESSEQPTVVEIINVSEIAKTFGGGGHVSASGCALRCSLAEARAKVIDACTHALDNPSLQVRLFQK